MKKQDSSGNPAELYPSHLELFMQLSIAFECQLEPLPNPLLTRGPCNVGTRRVWTAARTPEEENFSDYSISEAWQDLETGWEDC